MKEIKMASKELLEGMYAQGQHPVEQVEIGNVHDGDWNCYLYKDTWSDGKSRSFIVNCRYAPNLFYRWMQRIFCGIRWERKDG